MEEIKILLFTLSNKLFALDIMDVERILENGKKTIIPDVPDYFEGVIKYETNVIPVINLDSKFKFPKKFSEDYGRIIVIKTEIGLIGIIVDEVLEVKNIYKEDLHKPKSIDLLVNKKYVKGIVKEQDTLIVLLESMNLLKKEETLVVLEEVE